jgi:hypothetical protein
MFICDELEREDYPNNNIIQCDSSDVFVRLWLGYNVDMSLDLRVFGNDTGGLTVGQGGRPSRKGIKSDTVLYIRDLGAYDG